MRNWEVTKKMSSQIVRKSRQNLVVKKLFFKKIKIIFFQ